MDIHRLAAWAQVLSFPTGAYCAYGTYVNLHPDSGGSIAVIFNTTAYAICFGAFVTCLLVALLAHIKLPWQRTTAVHESPSPHAQNESIHVESRVKHKLPICGITLHDTVIENYAPGLNYPRKLRLYLSNDGSDIDLGKGKWIAEGAQLQTDKPSTCEYEVKDHLGKWIGEASFKNIPSGKWFRLYVGLDSKAEEDQLKTMARNHSLGVLQIPARVDETDVVFKIRP